MGIFSFFKRFGAHIKCDKMQTEKYNWIFFNNKIQHLALNKTILVEENQLCIFRAKNKICDVLKNGEYKVTEDDLPLLFDRNNIHKKQQKLNNKNKKKSKKKLKKLRVVCDIYYLKENNISFVIPLKFKHNFNNAKIVEKINVNIKFNIFDVNKLCKFLFLEIATVSTPKFNKMLSNEFLKYIYAQLDKYQGEIADLTDADSSQAIRFKFTHEFAHYGIDVLDFTFLDYVDITKYKNNKIEDATTNKPVKEIENEEFEEEKQDEFEYANQEELKEYTQEEILTKNIEDITQTEITIENNEQNNIENKQNNETYKQVLESGKITINPNEDF